MTTTNNQISSSGERPPATARVLPAGRAKALGLLAGLAADLLIGDPERNHPVAIFGTLAAKLEDRAYQPSRLRGALVATTLMTGAAVAAEALARITSRPLALATVSWIAIGGSSLRSEAQAVVDLIEADDLDGARFRLRSLCGRDAADLDASEIYRAVVESLGENTSDAVVGPLVWGALAGPAGVAAYRAANTLDAMFGHRNDRYERFGWAAARLDDVMNLLPSRLTALLTAALAPAFGGSTANTLAVVRRDGTKHSSPNAGLPEAAFAAALSLKLGGPVSYQGTKIAMPLIGDGRRPNADDMRRAQSLSLAVGVAAALACAAALTAREHLIVSWRIRHHQNGGSPCCAS